MQGRFHRYYYTPSLPYKAVSFKNCISWIRSPAQWWTLITTNRSLRIKIDKKEIREKGAIYACWFMNEPVHQFSGEHEPTKNFTFFVV